MLYTQKDHNTTICSEALGADMSSHQSCSKEHPTQPWIIESWEGPIVSKEGTGVSNSKSMQITPNRLNTTTDWCTLTLGSMFGMINRLNPLRIPGCQSDSDGYNQILHDHVHGNGV